MLAETARAPRPIAGFGLGFRRVCKHQWNIERMMGAVAAAIARICEIELINPGRALLARARLGLDHLRSPAAPPPSSP